MKRQSFSHAAQPIWRSALLVLATALLGLTPTLSASDSDAQEALSLKVSAETIERLLNLEISDRRTIADWVSGSFIRGTTLTNAKAKLRVAPNPDNAALDLVIDSETTADSVGYNQPTRNIQVSVGFSTVTKATTTKRILLTERGILVTPAHSSATTAMTIHNVEVFAGGLFPRLKRRMAASAAWRKLMQEKSNQESQISQRVAGELNSMADAKAAEMLVPANQAFKKYFINGFYKKGRLPGRFMTRTSPDGLFVNVAAPSQAIQALNPRLEDPTRGELSAHLHGAVLNRMTESLLGGVEFRAGEIAEVIAFISGAREVIRRDDSFRIKLSENHPVEFGFDGGLVTMRLFVAAVTPKDGPAEPGAIIETKFLVTREDHQTARIRQEGPVIALPLPPAAAPSAIMQRFVAEQLNSPANALDRRFVFGALPAPVAELGTLELKDLTLNQGWLLFESNLVPAAAAAKPSNRTDKGAH